MKKVWLASSMTLLMLAMFCNGLLAWNVKLTWDPNDPSDNVTEYGVWKSTASGTGYNQIGTVPAGTQLEFMDQNLPPNTGPFFYVVTARNANGESDFSNEVRADEPRVPGPPVGLTIEVTVSP